MPRWIGVDGAERGTTVAFSLKDLLAPPATLLQPGDLQHFQLRTDIVQKLVDVLAKQAQLAAATGADISGIEHAAFPRQMGRQLLATAFLLVLFVIILGLATSFVSFLSLLGSAIGLQILKRQLQLVDLPLNLLR